MRNDSALDADLGTYSKTLIYQRAPMLSGNASIAKAHPLLSGHA
jgi:hypothetical protein